MWRAAGSRLELAKSPRRLAMALPFVVPLALHAAETAPLFPAPQSLEEVSAAAGRTGTRSDPRTALLETAATLRAKADLFRAGRCSREELRAAASEVSRAAAAYRAGNVGRR